MLSRLLFVKRFSIAQTTDVTSINVHVGIVNTAYRLRFISGWSFEEFVH